MPSKRHHTVPSFLLSRFGRETDRGTRVCQLEIDSGKAVQVSPRDATVIKHFYSFDFDGERHPLLEEVLSKVESAAAPIIERLCDVGADGLATHPNLPLDERAKLALFIGTSRIRTPIWREQTRSVIDQFAAFQSESGQEFQPPVVPTNENDLIRQIAATGGHSGWTLCMLDWTFVRPENTTFILGDTPISVFDPTPRDPGGPAGVMSSPNAQLFAPLDPSLGLLTSPNQERLPEIWEAVEAMAGMTDEQSLALVADLEGTTAEAIFSDAAAADLNLRTYANAQRYVFGSQEAVTNTRRDAKKRPTRVARYKPRPPRLHLLEDNPEQPGTMSALRVFEGPSDLPPRRKRQ